jgi:CHAT domain-containing protein
MWPMRWSLIGVYSSLAFGVQAADPPPLPEEDRLAARIEAAAADYSLETDAAALLGLAEREVQLRSAHQHQQPLAYAAALQRLALLQAERFDNARALHNAERAAQLIAATADADAGWRTRAQLRLGKALQDHRQFEPARDALVNGLKTADALPPLERAQAELWLVGVEAALQRIDQATLALDRAEAALAEANQPLHPAHANVLRYRARFALEAVKPAEALVLAEQAAARARAAQPYSGDVHFAALSMRGSIEFTMGNFPAARAWGEQALVIATATRLKAGARIASAHSSIAGSYFGSGEYAKALPHARLAVDTYEALPAPPSVELAGAWNTLGSVQAKLGSDADAISALNKAIGYAQQAGPSVAALNMAAEGNLGQAYLRRGEYQQAETVLRRNLARFRPHTDFAERSPRTVQNSLAVALWGQGRHAEAFAMAMLAEASIARFRRVAAADLDQERALRAIDHAKGSVELLLAITAEAPTPQRVADTWNTALESFGLQTLLATRRVAAARAASSAQGVGAWRHWRAASERLSAARARAAREASDASDAALDGAEKELAAAELQMAKFSGDVGARLLQQWHSWAEIQRAIPADVTLLRFIDGQFNDTPSTYKSISTTPRQYALVGTRDGPPRLVALGRVADARQAVGDWYALASRADGDATKLSEAGRRVRALLFDPLLPAIRHRRVLVVPSTSMTRVAFAALPTEDGGYLVEAGWSFHMLSHERELLRAAATSAAPSRVLLAGAPDFGAMDSANTMRAGCASLRSEAFAALPGAGAELAAIAALAERQGVRVVRLQGRDATESAVRGALAGYGIVHLATHGIYLGEGCRIAAADARGIQLVDSAPSVRSDLSALTWRSSEGDDGLLTSDEIGTLDLSGVHWAVLAACETALGKDLNTEGTGGLRRAFALAGARTLIMSLWRVEDRSTSEFMRALYHARWQDDRADTAQAMRSAMLATLTQRRESGMSTSPYYWAAFVASGDWR